MKASRPSNPTGSLVELRGEELEQLIEMDGPVDPHALTAAVPISPEPTAPLDLAEPNDSEPATNAMRTGPGAARYTPERTERVKSSDYEAEPVAEIHTAKTADLRRGDAPARKDRDRGKSGRPKDGGRGKDRAKERSDAGIDEMLGKTVGTYRLLSLLGEGGMGRVYLAEHVKLGRKVALKLLRPEYAVKRDAVARFFQEARAVNQIGHENIVDITDFVELESGETFIIMELLQGEDLADIQRKSAQPMPLHRAMQISLQVCDALQAAHRSGIVHRDLKPDNIFIVNDATKRDFVKLLDFGVAKLLGNEISDGWQTAAGSVIGTPAYMSPEQAAGIPVDNRSDIYSLGAILYELFTGHPVFRAKSFGEFVIKHMNDDPIPPRELADAPSIPAALEAVILRCLEKDPNRRYPSVTDLREDLARATATVETVVRAMPLPPAGKRRTRRWPLWVGLSLGVALLAGAAFWIAAGLSVEEVTAPDEVREPAGGGAAGGALGGARRGDPGQTPTAEPSTRVVTAKLTLRTRPPGADVYRKTDLSTVLGQTPLELRLSNIGEKMEFVFRLAGHRDGVAVVEVVDNTVIGVDLEQIDDTAVRGPTHAPAGHPKTVRRPKKQPKSTGPVTEPLPPDPQPTPPTPPTPAPKTKSRPKKINPEDVVDPFGP